MQTNEQFRAAIAESGLTPPSDIVADGEIHRYSSNGKPGDNAGWYWLVDDPVSAGAFGCWRMDINEKWRANEHRDVSPRDQALYRDRVKSMQRAREDEEKKRKAEARAEAERIWKSALPALPDHPYLKAKSVKPFGLKVLKGELVARLINDTGIHSLQFISEDGTKRFLPGGMVKGCYHAIGRPDSTVCVVEGVATGLTVHEVTGLPIAVAFNAGNLLPVAKSLRERHPDLRLVMCADDDVNTPGNPGLTKAREAAEAVNGFLATPDFGPDRPNDSTDFNDLAQIAGTEAVRQCIEAAKSVAEEWPEPQPLPDLVTDVEPFDSQLLPKAFAQWVEDVSERMQAPPDYAAVGLMVALGAVVGRQVAIRPKATDD